MKFALRIVLFAALWVGFFSLPVYETGCAAGSTQQAKTVQTLKIVGQTAKTGMDGSTQLLKQGSITVAQWQKIADFYDNKFQPAYTLAVATAHADVSSLASPALLTLAGDFAALVAQYSTPTPH